MGAGFGHGRLEGVSHDGGQRFDDLGALDHGVQRLDRTASPSRRRRATSTPSSSPGRRHGRRAGPVRSGPNLVGRSSRGRSSRVAGRAPARRQRSPRSGWCRLRVGTAGHLDGLAVDRGTRAVDGRRRGEAGRRRLWHRRGAVERRSRRPRVEPSWRRATQWFLRIAASQASSESPPRGPGEPGRRSSLARSLRSDAAKQASSAVSEQPTSGTSTTMATRPRQATVGSGCAWTPRIRRRRGSASAAAPWRYRGRPALVGDAKAACWRGQRWSRPGSLGSWRSSWSSPGSATRCLDLSLFRVPEFAA